MAEYIERERICKNCVHHDACLFMLKTLTSVPDGHLERAANWETKCRLFKPAADVVEVRHGEWIEVEEVVDWLDNDVEIYYVCSICGCNDYGGSPYCPNCGAKMDGKGEGE